MRSSPGVLLFLLLHKAIFSSTYPCFSSLFLLLSLAVTSPDFSGGDGFTLELWFPQRACTDPPEHCTSDTSMTQALFPKSLKWDTRMG